MQFRSAWQQSLRLAALEPERHRLAYPELRYTVDFLFLYDRYPKAQYHYLGRYTAKTALLSAPFLVVFRDPDLESVHSLHSRHVPLLEAVRPMSVEWLKQEGVEQSAVFLYGFHSLPPMRQLHLHVISNDFQGTGLKHKKHWNSFTTEFFIPLNAAIETLRHQRSLEIDIAACKDLLKHELTCPYCLATFRQLPQAKQHISQCCRRSTAAKTR